MSISIFKYYENQMIRKTARLKKGVVSMFGESSLILYTVRDYVFFRYIIRMSYNTRIRTRHNRLFKVDRDAFIII